MFVARADAMAYAYYGASMECPLQPHWIACVFPVFVSHCFNELCPEREPDAFQGRSCALCSFFFFLLFGWKILPLPYWTLCHFGKAAPFTPVSTVLEDACLEF